MIRGILLVLALSAPISIERGDLKIELAHPGTYYQGTRFDWAGVFRRVEYKGEIFCDEWFETRDPLRHDNVCGPSEEFYGAVGYDEVPAGGTFLKVGVGMLVKEGGSEYDWTRTYPIADRGKRHLYRTHSKAVFTHLIKERYKYRKTVAIDKKNSFRVCHKMKNTGADTLYIRQYSHNFFTFGRDSVGPDRSVIFDFPISGDWREDNIHGRIDGSAIRMEGYMEKGNKSYIGNLKAEDESGNGYGFLLGDSGKAVRVCSDMPMAESVFWSNHRVFCPEPYIELTIAPGEKITWSIHYSLSLE